MFEIPFRQMNQNRRKPTVASLLSVISKLKQEHQHNVFKLDKKNEKLQDELSVWKAESIKDEGCIKSLRDEN